MLEPNSRRLLLESLQPPVDHRLDWAVGTTYSLDLMALLSAPVAFAFSDWQDRTGRPTVEPLALLKAVRQYADRICLFCQAGKIHVPRSYQPLLASLEDSIVEANAPHGGSFHPKLWYLRYVSADGSVIYRLLCLSRNLTFDRSWDTMLCLDGPLRDVKNAFRRNDPLGEFVEALPRMAPRGIAPQWQERLDQLAYEIRRVNFEVPAPFEEMDFWPLGIHEHAWWPFQEPMDRALVISPFVDDRMLADLAEPETRLQLISRPESLAALERETIALCDKVWVLDDTAEPEAGDAEEEIHANDDPGAHASEANKELPLLGLHAKLYVADSGWNARVWTGSANATQAAFEKNVEFLVELRGKRSRCGVEALLGTPENGSKQQATCLADLLRPYAAGDPEELLSADERAFEQRVERLAKQLAAAAPIADCEALDQPDSFAVTIRATEPVSAALMCGDTLQVWPISFSTTTPRPVDLSAQSWSRFEPISLLGLTAFFAFEVVSADRRFSRQFVLNIPLANAPAHRRESILRHLLSDPDRVLKFLLLLLTDHGARDFSHWFTDSADGDGPHSAMPGLFESTLFESLVRALDRDPERVDQVASMVDDLRQSEEGRKLLPPDFEAIWIPIWKVRERQIARAGSRRK